MSTPTVTGTDATGLKMIINGPGIPPGCICGYTWGLTPGQIIRNGPMSMCPADHAEVTS